MLKSIRRTIAILLIISLMYANLSGTIFGFISYAIEDGQEIDEQIVEPEIKKVLTVDVEEFYKNNMQEQESEYKEKLNIELNDENQFREIVILDIDTNISDGEIKEEKQQVDEEIEEEVVEQEKTIDIFYKSTQINKQELINVIGKNGSLEIMSKTLEISEEEIEKHENEEADKEETQTAEIERVEEIDVNTELENLDEEEIEKGIINIENNSVIINAETEANDEGIITVIYPENVNSVGIKILTDVDKIEKLEIINTRRIEKVEDLSKVNLLQTIKQIVVKDEEEFLNMQEVIETPIKYTMTKAELGMDKTELSNIVDNKVNFTITMLTSNIKYDLYKNPYFVIEVPNFIENINIDNILILNNSCFDIKETKQETLESGNKVVIVILEGEQLEYTKSNEENVQILIETTIKSNRLMPTTEAEIALYYQNENSKTFDGVGEETIGKDYSEVQFVSDKEILIQTSANIGEEIITSFDEQINTYTIEPNTYSSAIISGTIINNIGENIPNAKILGTISAAMGPISNAENVYYTVNENATADLNDVNNGWTSEYTQSAKKYLIVIDNFEQAQTIMFRYNMYMPEKVENDIEYKEFYEVYNNNNEIIKSSGLIIKQEAEHIQTYNDEKITAIIDLGENKNLEVGDYVLYNININNISEEDLKDISLNMELPEALKEAHIKVKVNEEYIKPYVKKQDSKIDIIKLNLPKEQYATIEIYANVGEYTNFIGNIKAAVNYEERQVVISDKVNFVKPSEIKTTITSNKVEKILDSNEEIIYTIAIYNNGESYSNVDVNLPESEAMNIQKIEATNLTTGKVNSMTSGSLNGTISGISINPGEIVEVKVTGLTKELKKENKAVMYASITGDGIEEISTPKLINKVNKKQEAIIPNIEKLPTENQQDKTNNNIIVGTAWVDKNENGEKDKNELVLKDIQATLIDTSTGKQVGKTTTNNEGEYSFEDIENGKYIVSFNYNTNKFAITEYKNEEVNDDVDSDVINTTQDNETLAKTELISLQQGKTENVNIGLVLSKKFDMSINKGITKVTVNNNQGVSTYNFDNTSMAKVEIDGEYLKGSLILVEYQVTVTNAGEIAGYIKAISDKIPEGMKFNSELNAEWYEENNGELYCKALADKELKPGETATVKLILTKEMTDDKVIAPVNTVEIKEEFNDYLVKDISTENNESEATIIISLTTGKTPTYIWLVIIVIAIIGSGTFGVIKITNKDSKKMTNKERSK